MVIRLLLTGLSPCLVGRRRFFLRKPSPSFQKVRGDIFRLCFGQAIEGELRNGASCRGRLGLHPIGGVPIDGRTGCEVVLTCVIDGHGEMEG
jgi:hypothetical protein